MLVVDENLRIPLKELQFDFVRSQGPGGQNVNKVNTKAVLRWPVATAASIPEDVRSRFLKRFHRRISGEGDLVISSQRFRDRGRNIADCIAKLRICWPKSPNLPHPVRPLARHAAAKFGADAGKTPNRRRNNCGDDHPAMSKKLTES